MRTKVEVGMIKVGKGVYSMAENEKLGFLIFFVLLIFALVWMAVMLHEDLKEISRKQTETIKFLKKNDMT